MYKRVMLKLSGEALRNRENVYDVEVLKGISEQVKKMVADGIKVGIVIGGGNIVRGATMEAIGFERVAADFIGMVATALNAKALETIMLKNGLKAKAMSAVKVENIDDLDIEEANRLLAEDTVVIFGGGIGKPYFSTDTACAQRAQEMGAEVILMAKNGTDGVYDSSPSKNPNAVKFQKLTFDDMINLNLQVMDQSACQIMRANRINAFVFDMAVTDNIYLAACDKAEGTLVYNA